VVLWLIGMSGSGKTTLGQYIYMKLKPKYNNLLFLDGDIFREIMGDDLGHTIEDRRENAGRITRLCKYLDSQDIHVIFAILSLFHESQQWNRENIKDYYEVYIKCVFDTLAKRDNKNIYKKALNDEIKNVVGVDVDFPAPKNPNMIVTNDGSIEELYVNGDKIIEKIGSILK